MSEDRIIITINLGNAAATREDVPQILRTLADRIEAHGLDRVKKVQDLNGNTIGGVR